MVILLFVFSPLVHADHILSGRLGEPLQPMEECNISLISENVVLTHDGRYSASVKGEYVLMNNGESSDVKIGILKYSYLRKTDPGPEENRELRNLKIYVNGIEITPEDITQTGISSHDKTVWAVFEVAFSDSETININCEYDISLAYQENGDMSFGYFLSKNAGWFGDVGHSTITFKVTNTFAYGIHSIYRELKNGFFDNVYMSDLSHFTYQHFYPSGEIIYENTGYEPIDDIEIIISNRAWPDYPNMVALRNDAKIDSVKFFQYAPFNEGDQLKALYSNLKYNTKLIETLYAKTKIGVAETPQPPVAVRIATGIHNGFSVYVKDADFNFSNNCSLIARDNSGEILETFPLSFNQKFGDFGEAIYFAYDKNLILDSIHTYEVTLEDPSGNHSVTVFNIDKKVVSMTVNGNEVDIPNPETSVPMPYLLLSILLLISGIVMVLYRLRRTKDCQDIAAG